MTNRKIPSTYEIRTIAEHAMRRLFQASGRSWEEFNPEDAQRCEWLEQALVLPTETAETLNAERAEWNVPRKAVMRPLISEKTSERLSARLSSEESAA